jgi:hypothetical protein
MKDKILALLTAAFAGTRKDGLNQLARILALQATTDDEAKALVDKLTKAQVDEFVKEFRAEVDKEVSEGNKTFETNLKKKFDFVERKKTEPDKDEKDKKDGGDNSSTGDIAAIVKAAVAEAVKPFQTDLAGFRAGELQKTRLQSLNDKLNTCKDDTFKAKALKDFARMKFETDDEFTEYLTDTEKDIATANQNAANNALAAHERPFSGQKTESGVSVGVAQYVDSQKKENQTFSGKEV